MTRVLITGGTGMVGRNLLEHPAAEDHECMAPDRPELNLLDQADCRSFIKKHLPDVIVHTAGKVGGIQANMADPVGYLTENLTMGCNIVMAARAARVPALLNLGSSCMYPKDAPNPLQESALLSGLPETTNEGYALAKITVSRLCEYISQCDGLNYRTIIPCNIYGPYDKFDPAVSHLVPGIIHKMHAAIRNAKDEIEIWGDGSARRESMYSADLADGIWHLLKRIDAMPALVNLGIGHDHTVLAYYQAAAAVMGWRGQFVFNLNRPVGFRQKLVSVERQAQLGWSPKTTLQDGIGLTYAYFLSLPASG